MSHFYGTLQGNRGEATRCGTEASGITAVAASWDGCIEIVLRYDPATDTDWYEVWSRKWHGRGNNHLISRGKVGYPPPKEGEQLSLFEGTVV